MLGVSEAYQVEGRRLVDADLFWGSCYPVWGRFVGCRLWRCEPPLFLCLLGVGGGVFGRARSAPGLLAGGLVRLGGCECLPDGFGVEWVVGFEPGSAESCVGDSVVTADHFELAKFDVGWCPWRVGSPAVFPDAD
jgi:hypothetical protein